MTIMVDVLATKTKFLGKSAVLERIEEVEGIVASVAGRSCGRG